MTVQVPDIRGRNAGSRRSDFRVLHVVDHVMQDQRPAILDRILEQRPDDEILTLPPGGHAGQPSWLMSVRWILGGDDGGISLLINRARAEGRPFSLIHGWGTRALSLVGYTGGCGGRLATIDSFVSDAPAATQASNVLRSGRLPVFVSSDIAWRSAMQLTGPAGIRTGRDQLHCPVVHPDQLASDRDEVRARWNVGSDTMVIGLLGNPMCEINLRDLSGIPVRCRILGRDPVLVISSTGARRGDLLRWMERVAPEIRIVVDDALDCSRDVVAAMDVVLAPSAMGRETRICSVEPVMAAVAAGLPVILGDDHPASEWAHEEPLIFVDASHDEHAAIQWLFTRAEESMESIRQRVVLRCDHVRDSITESYGRILESSNSSAAS
ncbi:MAG: hypothetical protein CMJ39_05350 [Phycisphaerae bacterium]|nr:hypothetical protein [Phycisphaerae bacterium]